MQNKNKHKTENSQLNSVRKEMYEEFFYSFYNNRRKVYWMNFVRGIFFGLGTFLSGTIVIALIVWLLSQFVTIPLIGDFVKQILDAIQGA
jgi:hypothetical protein